MGKRNVQRHGQIQTDIAYNDRAETEIMLESFDYKGFRVALFHPCEGDNPDKMPVSVETSEGWHVMVYHDHIEISDDDGWVTASDTWANMAKKVAIANKLAEINRWQ